MYHGQITYHDLSIILLSNVDVFLLWLKHIDQ